jgi:hypothetical protein
MLQWDGCAVSATQAKKFRYTVPVGLVYPSKVSVGLYDTRCKLLGALGSRVFATCLPCICDVVRRSLSLYMFIVRGTSEAVT